MHAIQTNTEGDDPRWFKSSYSSGSGGNCLEVAADHDRVRIRDSKWTEGPVVAVTTQAFSSLIASIRHS
ncbi:DUF397 domain-containing protein [Streptomyces sp. NPDC088141]|uniref:DUF397 domain-containing protein n=1 Tax=unclassified Streptomyces TaxID=2593676 RepID=UPI003446481F